jgi:ABC-type glycerol-3-phosphate transport system permease component
LTIAMLPVLVLYLLLQRRFIEGITAGALKS